MNKKLSLLAACLCFSAMSANAQRMTALSNDWMFSLEGGEAQKVSIPHDWSVVLPTSADAPMGNDGGYFPAGKGKYTKTFKAAEAWKDRKLSLLFEGVYMNATVLLNGKQVATHAYGWTPFEVDVTDCISFDKDNVLEVLVDNSKQRNSRWYTGSGIYRMVWLKSVPKTDAIGDYAVSSVKKGDDYVMRLDCATDVEGELRAADGSVVAKGKFPLTVKNPSEWSPESPALYSLSLYSKTDTVSTRVGFRTVEYSANGLKLNGKPIVLSGACVHHDNGPLGAAAYRDAEFRRVQWLKDAGFNAVRTSHNPSSSAFLDACDSIGLLVVDEIFDKWRAACTQYDYSTIFDRDWQQDVDSWVKRDVNHPSVWCWSVGNEVMERTDPECVMTARKLIGRVHSLDPYRPVTSAMCSWNQGWERFDNLMAEHDICGYNYYIHEAPNDHKRVPSRVIMQTESYPRDAVSNYHYVRDNDCVIGDFVWTGIDYLGEAGIGRNYYEGQTPGEPWEAAHFPWHGSHCGDIDLIGWRKPISHLRDVLYNEGNEELYIAVREPDGYYGKIHTTQWSVWPTWPRWTWAGWEGKPVDVEVYTRAQKVRLYLNNKLVGEADVKDCTAQFTVNYAAGTLRAEAVNDGTVVRKAQLKTAGKAARIKIEETGGNELRFITATIVDKNGTPVPEQFDITFTATGTELLCTATGDLSDTVPYPSPTRKTWNSQAQAIVRTVPGAQITIKAGGLKSVHKLQ